MFVEAQHTGTDDFSLSIYGAVLVICETMVILIIFN